MSEMLTRNRINIAQLVERLTNVGAASLPIIANHFRRALRDEAERYQYVREAEVVGTGQNIVRQQLEACECIPPTDGAMLLKIAFQTLMDRSLTASPTYPFSSRLDLNACVLQRYQPGSIGITPHRDGLRFVNLVCIFVIAGRGRFYVCADRAGNAPQEISAPPGNVVLMRAPGFLAACERPFHYVAEIKNTRLTFALRQTRQTKRTA
jgi:hypothetical protein